MYKLSPSDFAYLYEECKLCYYLKAKGIMDRPRALMPGVFNAINSRVQGSLVGKNLKTIFPDLPDGEIVSQEGFIESKPIPETSVFIKGKYDLLMKNPGGTYTIIDLKLSQPGEDKGEKYMTQLASYKFAFESPKMGEPIKVSGHALLIFYPDKVMYKDGVVHLDFPHTWIDVKIDDQIFIHFMKEIDKLLSGPQPDASPTCKWCEYREFLKKPKFVTDELPF